MTYLRAPRQRHEEFHGRPLEVPPDMPPAMAAELHYLYSLLIFSDAKPAQLAFTDPTGCGRIHYDRDGKPWVLVIRQADP